VADFRTAVHEAGHATAGWAHGIEVRFVTVASVHRDRSGCVYFNADTAPDDAIACAVVKLAGPLAAAMYASGDPTRARINWLRAADGCADEDIPCAAFFLGATTDPLKARRIAELRTRGLLLTRWHSVLALARELERRGSVFGHDVDRICITTGARTYAQIGGTR
jgi:hypothetical protein